MKPLNPQLKTLFEALLVKRGIPLKIRFHYVKWLRYYLDFCLKHHYDRSNRETSYHFIEKLKEKRQTEQQQKQVFHAISLWDFCKTPPFAQSRRQAQISILKIFNIFLRLKFSPSLTLGKTEHFSKVSLYHEILSNERAKIKTIKRKTEAYSKKKDRTVKNGLFSLG